MELLTDINMLLMVEKSIISGICHSIRWYTKANNKYNKSKDRNGESLFLTVEILNICG